MKKSGVKGHPFKSSPSLDSQKSARVPGEQTLPPRSLRKAPVA